MTGPAGSAGRSDKELRTERLDRLVRKLPARLQPPLRWLRKPSSRWARVPAGLLLSAGGILGALPVVGFWMLPLGVALLAEDVPPLRRASASLLGWVERRHPAWLAPPERRG